jgi:2-succinyl-5-enolpyruvyl-6-hydroxy-3-cyclohexene-1-carboxylate synthase
LKDLGAPVVADATSGLREVLGSLAMIDGDGLLRREAPGKVLRIGDVPVGRFWRDLGKKPEIEVLSVTRTGFSGLARASVVITGRVHETLRGMGEPPKIGDARDYLRHAGKRAGRLDELLERYPDSEPGMMRDVSTYATMGESVFLGNSLPIREWNLCAQRTMPMVNVRANRGANGIDGQLSTWLGATVEQDGAWGIFGDLTVLYDLAAPALLAQVRGEGRVLVVVNNGGGRIFERLPRLGGLPERERALMSNAHGTRFADWAAMWGMGHLEVNGREDLEVEPGERPVVVELRPDEKQTAGFWREWDET